MSDAVYLSDIVLKSINSYWYNSNRKKCNEDEFKMHMKIVNISYDHACELYGKQSKAAIKAKQKLDYIMNQIDKDESDMFALMMFKTADWEL